MRSRRARRFRRGRRRVPYPNQWRRVRRLRGYTQRDVARYLGHVDIDSYYEIERGRRFPRAENLMLLLRLFAVTLEQVYPDLAWGADRCIDETRRRLTG